MFSSGQFHVSFRTIRLVTLGEGELQYLKVITVMTGDGGRGHYVLCRGPQLSSRRLRSAGESGARGENRQLLPAEGPCH